MKVFITGLGAVSCLGNGIAAHRLAFGCGEPGVGHIGENGAGLPPDGIAGVVRNIDVGARPKVERFLQLAMQEALVDARLHPQKRVAMFIGSAHGDLDSWQAYRRGRDGFENGLWNMLGGSPEGGEDPEITVVSTACTASAVALGLAFDALRMGEAEVAVVAGVESLTSFLYRGFESLKSLAGDYCRPFDRDRSGLILGEGAAAIVLETEDHARRRHGRLAIEVTGYGFAADGAHLTAPDPAGNGAAQALLRAIEQAGLSGVPDFINAHGTGTKLNDRMECIALQRVFGDKAAAIPVTSTKPMTGHMCGAAGAMEIVSTVIGLETGSVPPIVGFRAPDEEFEAMSFVRGEARLGEYRTAVSMNSGFGGTNTAIVLERSCP